MEKIVINQINHKWQPISPLSDGDRAIDASDLVPLYESWHSVKNRLRNDNPQSFKQFSERLVRSLSIETGILERLYDLDRGTTEALVMRGFVEDLVTKSSTDIEPSLLIDILRDQEAAVALVTDCVAKNRALTKGVIHELHVILTQHQDTTKAIDQFGNRREIPLLKGTYKEYPNNPTRPDGIVHEYCPPVHVESEMENLLSWLDDYREEDPLLVTAWFHHRFAQIHAYQDGNGRLARALSTLTLLRADLLPLVIDRDVRVEYIESLEAADSGDLARLFALFGVLEKRAILQALSVDADAEIARDRTITRAVIDSLADKFERRKRTKDKQLRKVNDVAISIRQATQGLVETTFKELKQTVAQIARAENYVGPGGSDFGNEYWYRREVVDTAQAAGKWVNFDENHYFVKATIRVENVRLVFVTSIHHIGRELSGVMEIGAFAFLEFYEEKNDRSAASERFFHCSLDPFVITWNTDAAKVQVAYEKWFDAALAVAVKEWGDQV